jgi:uncharacterized protein involved in exopolysaccharide biosynthesis
MTETAEPVTAETERIGAMGDGNHMMTATELAAPEQSGIAEYARVLWRRKWIIIITTVVAVVGVLGYCVVSSKTYTATATVELLPDVSNLLNQSGNSVNPTVSDVNVSDVIQVIESSSISSIVAKTIPNPPSASASQVGTIDTTDIVNVSASSGSPQTAAAAANAFANSYINYERGINKSVFTSAAAQLQNKVNTVNIAISNITNQIRSTPAGTNTDSSTVELSDLENQLTTLENELQTDQFYSTQGTNSEVGRVITAATVPTKPSSPKTSEYTVLALIFGLIAGVGLALLVNSISRRRV